VVRGRYSGGTHLRRSWVGDVNDFSGQRKGAIFLVQVANSRNKQGLANTSTEKRVPKNKVIIKIHVSNPRATRDVGAGLEREVVGQLISVPPLSKTRLNPGALNPLLGPQPNRQVGKMPF